MQSVVMLPINRILLAPEKLALIPDDERALMLWTGHIHNELIVLLGFVGAVGHTKCDSALEKEANAAQLLVLAKLVAGKLWEAWQLLEKGFFKTKLSKKYNSLLRDDELRALDVLKGYFNKPSALYELRNSYSFHYDFDALRTLPQDWQAAPDDLAFYNGGFPRYTLYFVSESIVNRTMFSQIGAGNVTDGVRRFWSEISSINSPMIGVCGGIFTAVFEQYIAKTLSEAMSVTVGILNPPRDGEVSAPFFVMPPLKPGL